VLQPTARRDLDQRARFLARKAKLFTRIANQHAHTDPGYAEHVRQIEAQAHAAAEHTTLRPRGQLTGEPSPVSPSPLGQITEEDRGQFWLTQPLPAPGPLPCPHEPAGAVDSRRP